MSAARTASIAASVLDAVRDAPFNILHVCRNHNRVDILIDYPLPSTGLIGARETRACAR
jgi:hypothetical protein